MASGRILILEAWSGEDRVSSSPGAELQAMLQGQAGYQVDLLDQELDGGTAELEPSVDLIVPVLSPSAPESVLQLLRGLWARGHEPPILPVLTAAGLHGQPEDLWLRVPDFLVMPLEELEVRARVRRLLAEPRGWDRARFHQRMVAAVGLSQLRGEAPAFVAVKRRLSLMARGDAPVLITGETGTGKGLCARSLHYLSDRAAKPFLPVNCGAIPLELFESELFGHQKGAFTSAWAAQPGLIGEAEGGTLFLDEIEALALGSQVKLLHFLEDRTYRVLGSTRSRRADVRIIAATNVPLPEKVRAGTFRDDLFYRLSVFTLNLPPLRERRVDIPGLVAHFWERHAGAPGAQARQLSPAALQALCDYAWPGNIRQLENVIQQVITLTESPLVQPSDLPIPTASPPRESQAPSLKQAKAQVIAQFERAYLSELLEAHHGNISKAAAAAHKERRAFGRLIKKYRLSSARPEPV